MELGERRQHSFKKEELTSLEFRKHKILIPFLQKREKFACELRIHKSFHSDVNGSLPITTFFSRSIFHNKHYK